MTRPIGTINTAQIESDYVELVQLVRFDFDTPVYVHSGVGSIIYDGITYTGVGDLGEISDMSETALLSPTEITFRLSGVQPQHVTEAMNAANYGDAITVYEGYRQTDGELYDEPWVKWAGSVEYSSVVKGDQSVVEVYGKHELNDLDKANGTRYSDEDQVQRYAGDRIFEFCHRMSTVDLTWGGKRIAGGGGGAQRDDRGTDPAQLE